MGKINFDDMMPYVIAGKELLGTHGDRFVNMDEHGIKIGYQVAVYALHRKSEPQEFSDPADLSPALVSASQPQNLT